MSADNGTILAKISESEFKVSDYNASAGYEYAEKTFNNLEEALAEAQSRYTEYGVTMTGFDIPTPPKEQQ